MNASEWAKEPNLQPDTKDAYVRYKGGEFIGGPVADPTADLLVEHHNLCLDHPLVSAFGEKLRRPGFVCPAFPMNAAAL